MPTVVAGNRVDRVTRPSRDLGASRLAGVTGVGATVVLGSGESPQASAPSSRRSAAAYR